ncbi:hypothetical protein DB346_21615 [Verrucomicrobia bacterium LW23]|nr:hypothetical protein DB346_21615 [Verrucomicrobia bacterium LW23]
MNSIDHAFLGELTHWLSKSGELSFEAELRNLAPKLTNQEKIELYEYLRDNGERWESEWRGQFVELLGISEQLLPAVGEEEADGEEIFRLIDDGDIECLRQFVIHNGVLDQVFDPDTAYEEGKRVNEGKEKCEIVPFDFYPLEAANEDCEYPEPYARAQGKHEIADYLKAASEELRTRWKLAYEEGYRRQLSKAT